MQNNVLYFLGSSVKVSFYYQSTSVSGCVVPFCPSSRNSSAAELPSLFIDVSARSCRGRLSRGGARKSYLKVILGKSIYIFNYFKTVCSVSRVIITLYIYIRRKPGIVSLQLFFKLRYKKIQNFKLHV